MTRLDNATAFPHPIGPVKKRESPFFKPTRERHGGFFENP
jgi:hypothetical protein